MSIRFYLHFSVRLKTVVAKCLFVPAVVYLTAALLICNLVVIGGLLNGPADKSGPTSQSLSKEIG